MSVFSNAETKEVFVRTLVDWWNDADGTGIANGWVDIGNGSAVELLARQLRRDYWREYGAGIENDDLAGVFFRQGLRRVNWKQVATGLLRRCQPKPAGDAGGDRREEDGGQAPSV